ncbi:L-asparaginase I [Heterostelium album PN500]|uniref:asparaginase n=1 Tax=Heterostelium pallidum (strain ATCC 26659 / Pp 5 / PN500) TaxID=670386 RepID=D3BT21_HETP5|nr:L-asparaginase I [Heterostelium album PN500]EFA75238.1 L-asparaginase I [Heterostelium album PN500]|eukprot:XP_020427372.1 L-asparaginase I [Heterostelium album PN500]
MLTTIFLLLILLKSTSSTLVLPTKYTNQIIINYFPNQDCGGSPYITEYYDTCSVSGLIAVYDDYYIEYTQTVDGGSSINCSLTDHSDVNATVNTKNYVNICLPHDNKYRSKIAKIANFNSEAIDLSKSGTCAAMFYSDDECTKNFVGYTLKKNLCVQEDTNKYAFFNCTDTELTSYSCDSTCKNCTIIDQNIHNATKECQNKSKWISNVSSGVYQQPHSLIITSICFVIFTYLMNGNKSAVLETTLNHGTSITSTRTSYTSTSNITVEEETEIKQKIQEVSGSNISLLRTSMSSISKVLKASVFIIYTGGTLGMKRDPIHGTLRPEPNYIVEQLEMLPEMKSPEMPSYKLTEFHPPIDSSDMDHEDWVKIAKMIEENYYDYDGFVIIHGTDTMAYTASALSFMLENLGKPVILTGSQIPIGDVINDAKRNLVTAIMFAGKFDIPEVCVFFNNQLLRGNRCRKIDSWSLAAFESPNCDPLGKLGMDFDINTNIVLRQPKGRFRVHETMNKNVLVLHLVPGFSDDCVENLLREPLEGLIIQSYGSGNAPAKKKHFLNLIVAAVKRGVVVVVTSQCVHGTVNLKHYETGKTLLDAGAVSGHDMTVEAAASKLGWLLSLGISKEQVRQLMEIDLRGELTISKTSSKILTFNHH